MHRCMLTHIDVLTHGHRGMCRYIYVCSHMCAEVCAQITYMCAHITYTCARTCAEVRAHITYMCARTCAHTYINVSLHACTQRCVHISHTHVLTHVQRCACTCTHMCSHMHIHTCAIAHMPKELCEHIIYSCARICAHRGVCIHTRTCTRRPRKLQGGNRRKVRRTCSQENTERGDIR